MNTINSEEKTFSVDIIPVDRFTYPTKRPVGDATFTVISNEGNVDCTIPESAQFKLSNNFWKASTTFTFNATKEDNGKIIAIQASVEMDTGTITYPAEFVVNIENNVRIEINYTGSSGVGGASTAYVYTYGATKYVQFYSLDGVVLIDSVGEGYTASTSLLSVDEDVESETYYLNFVAVDNASLSYSLGFYVNDELLYSESGSGEERVFQITVNADGTISVT